MLPIICMNRYTQSLAFFSLKGIPDFSFPFAHLLRLINGMRLLQALFVFGNFAEV